MTSPCTLTPLSLQGLGIGVSGGGTHIGRALALGLAEAGATVVIFGRRSEPLDETVELASELAGSIVAEVADQHLADDLERVLDRIEREAGAVHGWVNNAYRGATSQLMPLERQNLEGAFRRGLSDLMLAAEAAAKRMAAGQGGSVAFRSSSISSHVTGQDLAVDGGWTAW